jgi:5-formyltetrahydrofolate cyclo-ligase
MKRTLRQSIIAGRAALPEELHQDLSRKITARLLQLEAYHSVHTVMGYMHFGAEFISEPWLRQVLSDGKQLLLPRVNQSSRQLEVYRVEDLDAQLEPGAYGIREPLPEHCVPAELNELEFMLLPGVAFARNGARLGYGGGFYDKLLAKLTHRPVLVGAAFALQLVDGIPMEPTDQRIDWLVTEHETTDCRLIGTHEV